MLSRKIGIEEISVPHRDGRTPDEEKQLLALCGQIQTLAVQKINQELASQATLIQAANEMEELEKMFAKEAGQDRLLFKEAGTDYQTNIQETKNTLQASCQSQVTSLEATRDIGNFLLNQEKEKIDEMQKAIRAKETELQDLITKTANLKV